MASCSLEFPTVADAKDAGAAEDFDRVWGPCYVYVAASYDKVVTLADAEGLADSIDSAVVDRAEGPCSSEDFSSDFPPRPVRVCFLLFGPIVYTQCHRYWSSSYQFTFHVIIAFHKIYLHTKLGNLNLHAIQILVNDTYNTIDEVKQDKQNTIK